MQIIENSYYTYGVLGNGFKFYLNHNPSSYTVTITAAIRVGSRFEEEGLRGISHLLEHSVFRGTRNYPSRSHLSNYLHTAGGYANGSTHKEYQLYYVSILEENIDIGLEYIKEIISSPLLKAEDIELEKKRVLEELNEKEGNWFWQQSDAYIWGKTNSLSYNSGGYSDEITSITTDQLKSFFKSNIISNNVTLGISGNFYKEKTTEKINHFFASLSSGEKKSVVLTSNFIPNNTLHLIERNWKQTIVLITFFTGVHRTHKDRWILWLIYYFLKYLEKTSLHTRFSYEKGITYGVDVYSEIYSDTGNFSITSQLSEIKNIYEFITFTIIELKKFIEITISGELLEIAKKQSELDLLLRLENNSNMSKDLAIQGIMQDRVLLPQEIMREINNVTVDDIKRASNSYFREEVVRIIIGGRTTLLKTEELRSLIHDAWEAKVI